MAELYFLVLFWYYIVVSMLIVSEKNSCVSVFGPFLVHFTFLQSVLGFMGLFGVQQKTSLYRTKNKFAAFWYQKHWIGLFLQVAAWE